VTALRNLRILVRYSAWAHARLLEALAAMPQAELEASGPGAGSIVRTLNHMHVVDLIWRAHLEGKAHGFTARNTDELPAFQSLRQAQSALDAWFVAYAQAITPGAQDETVRFTFVDGGEGAMTRGEMLLHVVNHKTYHRGYVAEMLYRNGRKPPTMDLPVFLRDVPQPTV